MYVLVITEDLKLSRFLSRHLRDEGINYRITMPNMIGMRLDLSCYTKIIIGSYDFENMNYPSHMVEKMEKYEGKILFVGSGMYLYCMKNGLINDGKVNSTPTDSNSFSFREGEYKSFATPKISCCYSALDKSFHESMCEFLSGTGGSTSF